MTAFAGCGGSGKKNQPPRIAGAALATNEDQPGTVTLTATDADDDALTASISTQPTKGAATVAGSNPFTVTFSPSADRNGADSFVVSVSDGAGGTASATVTVAIAPVPDAPTIAAQTFAGSEDVVLGAQVAASDADGDVLTYTALTQPGHGALILAANGAFTFTPAADYYGADTFNVQVDDGTSTRTTSIGVTVAAVNDGPVAVDDDASIPASGATMVDVLANDSDVENDALTVSVETPPPGAAVSIVANQLQITPDAGALGPTTVRYRVSDGAGASSLGNLQLVMGSPRPLFYYSGDAGTPERRIHRYDFTSNVELGTPVPAGDRLESFVTSDDGRTMVYVTRQPSPVRHRLWLRDLVDLSAPVAEIATAGNFFVTDLRVSPDGTLVAFNGNLASTATPAQSLGIDGSGIGMQHPTFTRDSRKLFYTVNLAGGGRIIKRADVSASGAISNRVQMTANYNTAEGAGIEFRLTPDESRIVSLGLFMPPPLVGSAIAQYALVTPADGSMNDQRLHPELTTAIDGAGSLPEISTDGLHALYRGTLNGTSGIFASDLQAPGGVVNIAVDSPYVGSVLANGPGNAVYAQISSQETRWFSRAYAPVGSPEAFMPLANPGPRVVAVVPGGTALLFDVGPTIHLTPGAPFSSAQTLGRLPSSDPIPVLLSVSPDSGSAIAIGSAALTGLMVNPKAPGWSAVLDPSPASTFGILCVAYSGQGC